MKKALKFCWGLCIASIAAFVLTIFISKSDAAIWRMFSVMVVLLQIGFYGAILFTCIDSHKRSKEKRKLKEQETQTENKQ